MSTISPDVSGLLHEEAMNRQAHLIDLPVSGSTPAVEAGTVTLFGGGDPETFQPLCSNLQVDRKTVVSYGTGHCRHPDETRR